MQTEPISAASAIPLILVIIASIACWVGLAALISGAAQAGSLGGL